MSKLIVLCAVVLTMASMNVAEAFDGHRKGFVVGGGAGFSPHASWESDALGNPDDDGAGTGINVFVGYGWDRANLIGFEGNIVKYNTDVDNKQVDAYQGFRGISWYHYFGDEGRSFFTVAGLGLYAYIFEDFDSNTDGTNDQGGGFLAGGGYEFMKHWQLGVYASGGRTRTPHYDYDHTHVNFLVSGLVF